MAIVVVFLWLIAAILLIAVVFLATPVVLDLDARTEPKVFITVKASALGGLMPAISLFDSRRKKTRKRKKTAKKAKKKVSLRSTSGARGARIATSFPGLIIGLIGAFRFRRLVLDGDFGTGDPADTGHVFGLLTPILYGLPPSPRIDVALRPDFSRPRLSGHLNTAVELTPLALAPPILRFAWRAFGPVRWAR